MCPEAQKLWDAVADTNKQATRSFWRAGGEMYAGPRDPFEDYAVCLAEFEAHFVVAPVEAEQAGLL